MQNYLMQLNAIKKNKKISSVFLTMKYEVPSRAIFNEKDLESFKESPACSDFIQFVKACAMSVKGFPCSYREMNDEFPDCPPLSGTIKKFVTFMERLSDMIDDFPPLHQSMRFGNKAFRSWHSQLLLEIPVFLEGIIPSSEDSCDCILELAPYLATSFGNETRIDYGTGHEMTMALFFYCLFKIEILKKEDMKDLVLIAFPSYIRTMRRLQVDYLLEPAGSHGVWGLDDYHCLIFYWGASQLIDHPFILPSSIHDKSIIEEHGGDFLYLEGIRFIQQIKKGALFAETSPMLNDISGVGDWSRIAVGLSRIFENEVLFKLPVVQHTLFGSIFSKNWVSSNVSEGRSSQDFLGNDRMTPVHHLAGYYSTPGIPTTALGGKCCLPYTRLI